MAQNKHPEVHKKLTELSDLVGSQQFVAAMEKAGGDEKLYRKVKENPHEFLKEQGVHLPPDVELSATEQRLAVAVTICVTICARVGSFGVCVRICVTRRFEV